jgi:hypothetical protein
MNKFKKEISRFLNIKSVLVLSILLILAFFFKSYTIGIILILFFAPITFYTLRYSKMIPQVSAESNTAMSCFIGYVFGPAFGFFYSVSVGGTCYVMNSFVTLTYLSTMLFAGLCAIMMGILHSMRIDFNMAFAITIVLRTILAWFWFGLIGIDPLERFTHQTSQLLSNLIIWLPLLSALYGYIAPLVGN